MARCSFIGVSRGSVLFCLLRSVSFIYFVSTDVCQTPALGGSVYLLFTRLLWLFAMPVYGVWCLLLCCYSALRVLKQILWLTKECAICRHSGQRNEETAIAAEVGLRTCVGGLSRIAYLRRRLTTAQRVRCPKAVARIAACMFFCDVAHGAHWHHRDVSPVSLCANMVSHYNNFLTGARFVPCAFFRLKRWITPCYTGS